MTQNYRTINGKKYFKDKHIYENKADTYRFNKRIKADGGQATTIKTNEGYISVYRLSPTIKKKYKVRNTGTYHRRK